MTTITATFETRREADLVVEHLVQEHDFDRGDIVLESASDENSAGSEAGGADLAGFDDGNEDDAALNGSVKVTITLENEDLVDDVEDVLHEFGASDVQQTDPATLIRAVAERNRATWRVGKTPGTRRRGADRAERPARATGIP